MSEIAALINDHLDIWTSAIQRKNGAGRGDGKRVSLYGIGRLRALILDLAVRGKLLPQDASDEAASASLAQARKSLAEKANDVHRLRWRPSRPFNDDEIAKPIPPGWTLAQVNDTGFYINGLAFKPSDWSDTGRPIIRIQNLTNPNTPYNYAQGDYPDEVIVRDGDLLVSWSATLAAFQWSGEDAILNQHIFRVIHEPALTERAFLRLMLEHAIEEMAESDHAHGLVMTHINRGPFLDHLVKVPPLAEQRRIVAKVDELTALCDALERESAAALAAHQTLVETVLATLVNSADAADLTANWARLEAHFDTLFTTEASVAALKQTILDLAVCGKLVAQDAGDEMADILLERIQAERVKLLGVRRATKVSATTIEQNDLPDGWEWSPLARLGLTMTGGTPKSSKVENFDGSIPFIGPGQISPAGTILPTDKFVSEIGVGQSTEATDGDILMVCIGGSIGKSAVARARMAYNQQINAIRPIIAESGYVDLYLRCSKFQRAVLERATGSATPIINRSKWETIPVAVPPLAEQHRIIERVDALMGLCDDLKAFITDVGQTQMRLADTIVERAAA